MEHLDIAVHDGAGRIIAGQEGQDALGHVGVGVDAGHDGLVPFGDDLHGGGLLAVGQGRAARAQLLDQAVQGGEVGGNQDLSDQVLRDCEGGDVAAGVAVTGVNEPALLAKFLRSRPDAFVILSLPDGTALLPNCTHQENLVFAGYLDDNTDRTSWAVLTELYRTSASQTH